MRTPFLLLAALCTLFVPSQAQSTGDAAAKSSTQPIPPEIRDKYRVVEVDRFDLKQGLEFPTDYVPLVQQAVARRLQVEKLFARIAQPGEVVTGDQVPTVRLAGTIHNYKKGSRKGRYLGGPLGAGNAEIDARIALVDATTGQQLVAEEIRGVLAGGLFGGKDEDVTQILAAEIVSHIKLLLRRRIPPPQSADASGTAAGASPATEAERHTLIISAKNADEAQQKIDQAAAAGFCVVDFSLSGSSTAELELEKLTSPPETYQYRWVHMRLATHLQNALNEAAADGFHVFPHSLAWLGPYLSVLVEKSPVRAETQPQYKITQPMRVSSAQKDIEMYEREGYILQDELEPAYGRILLFEKTSEHVGQQEKN